MVPCSHDGFVNGDGILFYLAENELLFVGRAPTVNWIQFYAETGGYKVDVIWDDRSPSHPRGKAVTRRHYRFQVQGPNAEQILNKINGGPTCLRSIDAVLAVNAQQRYDSVKPIRKLPSDYTQDLLSGEIMVGFLPVHVAQGFVNSGRLTALAVGSPKRHPVAPTIATIEELGGKGVDVDMWYAFFAPGKTPAAVLGRLNTEIVAILKLPEVRELLGRAGLDAAASTPDELSAVVNKDFPRWGAVIKRNGISAE